MGRGECGVSKHITAEMSKVIVATALVQFVNTNPDYYCPVSSDLLWDGFLTKCGHHLCYNCCYPTNLHFHQSQTCPFDVQPLTIFPDNHLTNQIASSLVYCTHSMDLTETCRITSTTIVATLYYVQLVVVS